MNAAERLTIAKIPEGQSCRRAWGDPHLPGADLGRAAALSDVVAFLEETLAHEVRHCAMFREAMPARGARPCRVMSLWGNGGFVLGLLTALMGRQGIWICTAAVEFGCPPASRGPAEVSGRSGPGAPRPRAGDPGRGALPPASRGGADHNQGLWRRVLGDFISRSTDVAIWLSTWGNSTRMSRELAAAR